MNVHTIVSKKSVGLPQPKSRENRTFAAVIKKIVLLKKFDVYTFLDINVS